MINFPKPKDTSEMENKVISDDLRSTDKKVDNQEPPLKTTKVNGEIKGKVSSVDELNTSESIKKSQSPSEESKDSGDKNLASNSHQKTAEVSESSTVTDTKSDENSSEKVNTSFTEDRSQSKTTKDTPLENGTSKPNPLKKKRDSASSESRPDTPTSHSSLDMDLEEKLLEIDPDLAHDDQEDFCEEKLLLETDDEFILKDKEKEDNKSSEEKTISEEGEKSVSGKTDEGSSDRQEKEIEKILKNLNNSLENKNGIDNTESTTFRKITPSNNNLSLSNNSSENSDSKLSEDETVPDGGNNSSSSNSGKRKTSDTNDSNLVKRKLSNASDTSSDSKNTDVTKSSKVKNSAKRKLSDISSMGSNSNLGNEKLVDSNDDSDSNSASNKSSKSNSSLNISENTEKKTSGGPASVKGSQGKPKTTSEKNSAKSAITFSEALKSIAMEEDNLLQDKPRPLIPTTEITTANTITPPPSSSLTLLQPISRKRSSSSIPATDSENESQGKKRSLPGSFDSLKPDLKKIRIVKGVDITISDKVPNEKTVEEENGTSSSQETCKKIEKSIQERMEEDKESHKNGSIRDGIEPMAEKDLQRKAVEEMQKNLFPNGKLRRIKRKDLESIIIELFVDKVLYEHQLGQHKDLCKRLEATLESTRKKAAQFHKEIEDLKKVTHRLQAEHLARKSHLVAPVKVKRSVGIQATPTIIGKGMMNVSSSSNVKVLTPSIASSVPVVNNSSTNNNISNSSSKSNLSQVTTQPTVKAVNLSGQQPGAGTQVMVPFVVQPQNGGVGSQFIPVSTTRIVRTPLTPVNSSSTQFSPAPLTTTVTGAAIAAAATNPTASSFIDLTDDDEAAKSQRASLQAGGLVAIQRTTATGVNINQNSPGQFVTLNPPSSVGQLLLVPSSNGQPPTALVVGSVASTSNASGMVRTISQNSNVKITSPVGLVQSTRAVVGAQMNGGTFVTTAPRHPAPLPRAPPQQTSGYSKKLPPLPTLKLSHKENSIVLSWNMAKTDEHERIASYQIYAYQEGTAVPTPSLWKKVGSVKALELPMACTLTQFMPGHVYHFAVRAVDIRSRLGPFSDPKSIRLGN